jgi:hypothetical protein
MRPNNLPSLLSPEEFEIEINNLREAKTEASQYSNNKSSYINDKVFKYNNIFWAELLRLAGSESLPDRKFALAEYLKLAQKVLPTQLTGTDGNGLVVNVMNWAGNIESLPKEMEAPK